MKGMTMKPFGMKPLIRPPEYKDPDEDKRKRDHAAAKVSVARVLGGTPVSPVPAWKGMRKAGAPNPRQELIDDYKALREMVYGQVMPPHLRQFLGPPPSSAADRLYEHLKRKSGLLGLGASHKEVHDQTQTHKNTNEGEQEKGGDL